MSSLETGQYTISAVQFVSPEDPPLLSPLGLGTDADSGATVVVLPEGSQAPRWSVIRVIPGPDNHYVLRIFDKTARQGSDGPFVQASDGPVFEWKILQGAPSPPPIGNDTYAVFLPSSSSGSELGWGFDFQEADSKKESPVYLKPYGTPWYFVRVDRE